MNLSVSPAISAGQTVVVSYDQSAAGTEALGDSDGNKVADFTTGMDGIPAVVNNSAVDTSPPELTGATVASSGVAIELAFDEDLDLPATIPAALKDAFSVTAAGDTVEISGLAADGSSGLQIDLSSRILKDQAVVVSYDRSAAGTNALDDDAGNEVVDFTTGASGVPAVDNDSTQLSADATLSGLGFSVRNLASTALEAVDLSPAFDPGIETYSASVLFDNSEVTFMPETNDAGATVAYFDEDNTLLEDAETGTSAIAQGHQVATTVGPNIVKVKVTASDGMTEKTYTVTVTRELPTLRTATVQTDGTSVLLLWENDHPSGTGTLSAAAVAAFTVTADGVERQIMGIAEGISGSLLDVTLSIPTYKDQAVVVSYDSAAGLVDKDGNKFQSFTTGEDGIRAAVNNSTVVASTDATLSDLTVTAGGTDLVTFASGTFDYTAMVGTAVAVVTVTATKTETNATIEYLDATSNVTLTDADTGVTGQQVAVAVGNTIIKVKVTAADGVTTQTYTVTVNRAAAMLSTCTLNTGDLWCGVVAVGQNQISGVGTINYGFIGAVGDLSDNDGDKTFTIGMSPYTIDRVTVGAASGYLTFSLTSALTATDKENLVLHVGSASFAFSDRSASSVYDYAWVSTLDWSSESTVTLRLREAPSGPAAPTNFMARPAGDAKVALSWDAPASDSGVTRHEYQFKTDGSYSDWVEIANSAVSGANQAGFTVPDLTNEVPHTFQLRVVSGDGDGAAAMAGPVTPTPGICDRTQQVQDAILAELDDVDDCAAVTVADLETITYLEMPRKNVTALKSGDFAGLSALDHLQLRQNSLTELPSDLFSGLTALKILNLSNNALESLHPDVFSGLTAMENLSLGDNASLGTALPATVFSDLTSLQLLSLYRIGLETIPTGLFSGLSELTNILLDHNRLVTLPAGLFSGLTGLTELTLDGNLTDPLPLTVTLEKVEDGQVRGEGARGARRRTWSCR